MRRYFSALDPRWPDLEAVVDEPVLHLASAMGADFLRSDDPQRDPPSRVTGQPASSMPTVRHMTLCG